MIRFKAHSDGKVIIPDEPVDLPEGQLIVTLKEDKSYNDSQTMPTWVVKALDIAQRLDGLLPLDLAENHDFYAHGKPKS